jgi:PAS domain S-box-containing protein
MPPLPVGVFELEQLWQKVREPIFWLDQVLKLSWVNRAWENLTGYPAESVVGITCQAQGPACSGSLGDLAASFLPPRESLAGEPVGVPTLIVRSGGERIWRRVEFWPFRDQDDAPLGFLGIVRGLECQSITPNTESGQLCVELLELRRQLQERYGFDSLVGFGSAHRRLLDQVRLAAASTLPVLIVGEPGTGKRQVARTIHQNGPDRQQPLVSFDCEALPAEILERELFGADQHVPSDPHTPAYRSRGGRPRLALRDGSTLLVREILMLSRDLQLRLLESLAAPVRLLATTTSDPDSALKQELLRPELYFALTTVVVRLVPLRERRDELPTLAQHLLERTNQRGGKERTGFTPQAMKALAGYDWPGNIHELARVIDHAHARAQGNGPFIDLEDLPASIRGDLGGAFRPPAPPDSIKPLDELMTEIERRLIETALRQARGNKSRAAEVLGISRPRLYRRM